MPKIPICIKDLSFEYINIKNTLYCKLCNTPMIYIERNKLKELTENKNKRNLVVRNG